MMNETLDFENVSIEENLKNIFNNLIKAEMVHKKTNVKPCIKQRVT